RRIAGAADELSIPGPELFEANEVAFVQRPGVAHEKRPYGFPILERLHLGRERVGRQLRGLVRRSLSEGGLAGDVVERTRDRGTHNETTDSGSHAAALYSRLRCDDVLAFRAT